MSWNIFTPQDFQTSHWAGGVTTQLAIAPKGPPLQAGVLKCPKGSEQRGREQTSEVKDIREQMA